MTSTATDKPRLIGIEAAPGTCDRCDKELSKRRFIVQDGDQRLILGKKCAARITGWKFSEVDRQARMAARATVIADRRGRLLAEFPALTVAQTSSDVARGNVIIGDVVASDWAWRGDEWRAFVQRHLDDCNR